MKLLVTGATGFLGSHLVRALLKEGHQVIALKRSSSDIWRIADVLSEVILYNLDKNDLVQLFQKYDRIDAVIHTATCYGRKGEAASEVIEGNLLFPLKLLETALAYGTKTFLNTDTSLPRNINLYSLSKKQFADWGEFLVEHSSSQFVNIVLEHFFGPGDDSTKFTSYVFEGCLGNISELKLTAGEQQRDFIYIDDVVTAYLLLLDKMSETVPGFRSFGLGSGEAVSVRHFVETVHKLTRSKTHLMFGAIPYRENEIMEAKADIRALKSLGWSPKMTLMRGIEETIRRMAA